MWRQLNNCLTQPCQTYPGLLRHTQLYPGILYQHTQLYSGIQSHIRATQLYLSHIFKAISGHTQLYLNHIFKAISNQT